VRAAVGKLLRTAPQQGLIVALVGGTAVIAAALSLVALDDARRADREGAQVIGQDGATFHRVIYRFERSHYEQAVLADTAQLANLPLSVVSARRRKVAVHRFVGAALKSLGLSVASFDAEHAKQARQEAADIRIAKRQFAGQDRYARRANDAMLGLALTALAGAILGLTAALRTRAAAWIALATASVALLAAAALGVRALVL